MQIEIKKTKESKRRRHCPKCGSDLVLRMGLYGRAYICEDKKCRYTEPVVPVDENDGR